MKEDRPRGLYRPEFEHDACGVGVIADIKGRKSHRIIDQGIDVLRHLAHRGAEGSDPDTGDGAGILLQTPHAFFLHESGVDLPQRGEYGAGMVFLPQDQVERERCEEIIEEVVQAEGQQFLGWRDVPVDESRIGKTARAVRPVIRQFFVGRGSNALDQASLERKLYVIRKVIENRVVASGIKEADAFYISSLSSNTVVYKGLLTGTQVEHFYLDLKNPYMESGFAMVHSRFSTNTLGSWKLAHPYRYISHNGEINTLRGNINWMTARETLLASPLFGDDVEKLFPIITPRASDTANFGQCFRDARIGWQNSVPRHDDDDS